MSRRAARRATARRGCDSGGNCPQTTRSDRLDRGASASWSVRSHHLLTLLGLGTGSALTGVRDNGTSNPPPLPTSASVSGSGTTAHIECSWALPDLNPNGGSETNNTGTPNPTPPRTFWYGLDDDPLNKPSPVLVRPRPGGSKPTQLDARHHLIQVLPNANDAPALRRIELWAAADHPAGIGAISDVYWKVFHGDGSFKVQLHGVRIDQSSLNPDCKGPITANTNDPVHTSMFKAAIDNGELTDSAMNDPTNGMIALCQEGVKALFHNTFVVSKDQPNGEYKIETHRGIDRWTRDGADLLHRHHPVLRHGARLQFGQLRPDLPRVSRRRSTETRTSEPADRPSRIRATRPWGSLELQRSHPDQGPERQRGTGWEAHHHVRCVVRIDGGLDSAHSVDQLRGGDTVRRPRTASTVLERRRQARPLGRPAVHAAGRYLCGDRGGDRALADGEPVPDRSRPRVPYRTAACEARRDRILLGAFSAIALVLASIGIYGVLRLLGDATLARARDSHGARGGAVDGCFASSSARAWRSPPSASRSALSAALALTRLLGTQLYSDQADRSRDVRRRLVPARRDRLASQRSSPHCGRREWTRWWRSARSDSLYESTTKDLLSRVSWLAPRAGTLDPPLCSE